MADYALLAGLIIGVLLGTIIGHMVGDLLWQKIDDYNTAKAIHDAYYVKATQPDGNVLIGQHILFTMDETGQYTRFECVDYEEKMDWEKGGAE